MIEATGSGAGQWALKQLGRVVAAKFVLGPPVWCLVSLAQFVRLEEHETYLINFSKSGECGICSERI